MRPSKLLPIRGFGEALIFATAIFLSLLAIGHPIEELAITTAVFYAVIQLSASVIFFILLLVLKALSQYGEAVYRRMGIEVEEPAGQSPANDLSGKLPGLITLALLVITVLGVALAAGSIAVKVVGLSPLPGYFSRIAWTFALFGVAVWTVMLTLTALAFYTVNRWAKGGSIWLRQLPNAAMGATGRLRNAGMKPIFSKGT